MATRTSSPPGSRSKSTSSSRSSRSGRSGSSTRSRSTRKGSNATEEPQEDASRSRRPAPRAVRNGPGPVSRAFGALGHGSPRSGWAIAHALGATARSIGRTARDLDPEHRRDGVGLVLVALAVVAAAAVWWQLPGAIMDVARTIVSGSVGKVGWFVPLMLVLIGWRNMRDPEHNGPAGRQVVGWAALAFGVLGIVHIADGNPQPDPRRHRAPCTTAGGAIGYVVSSLLLDLLRTAYVVVPLLALLAVFGVLVITATPVYQVPARLAEARDRLLGRTPDDRPTTDEADPADPAPSGAAGDDVDPEG